MGLVLRQADRLEEAVVALRQAVKRAPRDAQAQGNLAGVLKELGRPAEAEDCYRAALRLQPDDPVLHLNLGIALLLAGRFDAGLGGIRVAIPRRRGAGSAVRPSRAGMAKSWPAARC